MGSCRATIAPAKLAWLVDTDCAHWMPEPSRISTMSRLVRSPAPRSIISPESVARPQRPRPSCTAPAGVWKATATDSRPGRSSPRRTMPLSSVAEWRVCFTVSDKVGGDGERKRRGQEKAREGGNGRWISGGRTAPALLPPWSFPHRRPGGLPSPQEHLPRIAACEKSAANSVEGAARADFSQAPSFQGPSFQGLSEERCQRRAGSRSWNCQEALSTTL